MASQKDYCPLLPQDQEREAGGPPAKTLEAEGVPCKSARRRRLELRRLRPDVDIATGYCSPLPSPPSAATLSASSDEISADRAAEAFGSISVIGRRREMEDAVAVAPAFAAADLSGDRPYDFCGVYDGHSGARVAQECGARMHVVVAEEMAARRPEAAGGGDEGIGWWTDVMAASFERIDGEMAEEAVATVDMTVGSTAVVAVVGQDRIVVANCGDSRAVLSRGRIAVPLSSDHKPDRPDELERVEAAGGRVIDWNGYRVFGVLATSRSIGDHYLRPYIISEPEVTVTNRTEKDEFLILASDGLWDVVSNELACRVTRQCLRGRATGKTPELPRRRTATEAAALLAELALSRGSKDNISVVVAHLKRLCCS